MLNSAWHRSHHLQQLHHPPDCMVSGRSPFTMTHCICDRGGPCNNHHATMSTSLAFTSSLCKLALLVLQIEVPTNAITFGSVVIQITNLLRRTFAPLALALPVCRIIFMTFAFRGLVWIGGRCTLPRTWQQMICNCRITFKSREGFVQRWCAIRPFLQWWQLLRGPRSLPMQLYPLSCTAPLKPVCTLGEGASARSQEETDGTSPFSKKYMHPWDRMQAHAL